MNTPTKPKDIQKINKMYWEMQELVTNLYNRWLDEGQYEGISGYEKVFAKALKKYNFNLIAVTKKPFGFKFKINNTNATYSIGINGTQYKWFRKL
jgi:hypothetical protein